MPLEPHVVVAAGVGANVDDERLRSGSLHACERSARELVELRLLAPVELVDGQHRLPRVRHLETKQLLERSICVDRRHCAAALDDRFDARHFQPIRLLVAEQLPVEERKACRQQRRLERRGVAIDVRKQAFGYLPPRDSVDGVDAPTLQCARLAIERGADEELSVRGDVHVERKQSTAAAEVTAELCARPARKGHDQVAVRHDRVQCRHRQPRLRPASCCDRAAL